MSLMQTPEDRQPAQYAGTWHSADGEKLVMITGGRGSESFIGVENPDTGERRIVSMGMLISYATADGILAKPEPAPAAPTLADIEAAHARVAEADLDPADAGNAAPEGEQIVEAAATVTVVSDPAPKKRARK